MPLQTLPSSARKYSAAQLADIDAALAKIEAQWGQIGPQFDTGWSLVGPSITATVLNTQRDLALRATGYIPAVLQATGQSAVAVANTNAEAFVGTTGAGYPVAESLVAATIAAKQAISAGATTPQALVSAGTWLQQAATTVFADTMRGAEGVSRYTRSVGFIRMVHGGACGRCVVLAGRWYRTNAGFLRHPRCRCTSIPASEDVAGDWQTNPDEYFHSLTPEQQIKLMGSKANAQAILDGADIGRVINAYRKTAGMSFAQVSPFKRETNGLKFSPVTKRSASFKAANAARTNSSFSGLRLMPESIYRTARNRDDALRLLRINGWIF